MNLKKMIFSSHSLGNVKFLYTDEHFYKNKKENIIKNKSYTLSYYKKIFRNYYKNKIIDNN